MREALYTAPGTLCDLGMVNELEAVAGGVTRGGGARKWASHGIVSDAVTGPPATLKAELTAARRDAPGTGSVRKARWSAAEGPLACGRTRSLLASGEGSGRTQFQEQGFWASGPRQRLRTLLPEGKTGMKLPELGPRQSLALGRTEPCAQSWGPGQSPGAGEFRLDGAS